MNYEHSETATQEGRAGVSAWFLVVVALFITCLITANIIAVKLVDLWGLTLPAAVILFPLSYIIGDVLTEVYGYSRARWVIWLGFSCNLLAVAAIWLGLLLPPAPFWQGQDAYASILGLTPRILVASFLAYLAGEFLNAYVLAKLKILTNGRWLWTRTIGSTLLGEGVDSLIFISVAFWGTIPVGGMASAIVTQWLVKCTYETLATPATYKVVSFLKKAEGQDYFDRKTRFNPLAIGGTT